MKRRISFIFAFALLCMSSVVAQVTSGTCGDNLTWVLTEEGELIVEGTGDMYDYHEDYSGKINHPWLECRSQIKTITIGEGVTSIGNTAFRDCTELTSISLNNGLKHIGVEAFRYCGQLTAIDFPESLTSIANSSFFECRGLLSVTIPEGITSIDFSTFYDCSSLKSLILPSGMTSIGGDAFKACHNLTEIVCKATTPPSISSSTFSNVSREAFVYVPQASISTYESTEYWSEFTNFRPIGTCGDNLTWRITPEDELIVEGTGEMTSAPWFDIEEYRHAIKKATIMEGVTSIADAAFHYCINMVSISIPESMTSIGDHAFRFCSSLTSVVVPEGVTSIGSEIFQHCSSLTEVNIPKNVTSIGIYAFQNCQFTTITIPEKVATIGPSAFDGCNKLTSMTCLATTPPVLENSSVFYGVDKAIPVYVPLASIEVYKATDGWKDFTNFIGVGSCGSNLTFVLSPDGELVIEGTGEMNNYEQENSPWYNYRESIKAITIEEGVTSIGSYAFQGCNKIETMTIPQGVVTIGECALYRCTGTLFLNSMPETSGEYMMGGMLEGSSFTKVVVGNGITEIKDRTFCFSSLQEIVLPEGLTKIGASAFECCWNLTSITIPANVTEIGSYAFMMCDRLTSIICEATAPPVCNDHVFDNITSLFVPMAAMDDYQTTLGWKDSENIVGFASCGDDLTCELWSDGKLTIMGKGAITDTPWKGYEEQVRTLVIDEGVTSFADGTFADFSNLVTITSYAEVPPICGTDVFAGIDKTTPVYVPVDAVEAYGAAEGWEAFTYLSSMNSRVLLDTYTAYAHAEDEEFDKITYVRNFTSKNWEALYLPFEIGYEDICEDFDVAYIYDTHQYDTDDNGVKDETVIEIFKIKEGTLEANYPYLIRAKEAGQKEIVVNDATLYATEEVTLDCSSIFDTYTFTTTYSSIPAGGFEQEKNYYTLVDGMWLPASKYTELGAFRFYLKVDSRSGAPAAEAQSIRMRIVGEDNEGGTTDDIENSEITIQNSGTIFDLSGRRLTHPTKGINIIQMTDGSVRKKMVK